jgi:hypothetical protein
VQEYCYSDTEIWEIQHSFQTQNAHLYGSGQCLFIWYLFVISQQKFIEFLLAYTQESVYISHQYLRVHFCNLSAPQTEEEEVRKDKTI